MMRCRRRIACAGSPVLTQRSRGDQHRRRHLRKCPHTDHPGESATRTSRVGRLYVVAVACRGPEKAACAAAMSLACWFVTHHPPGLMQYCSNCCSAPPGLRVRLGQSSALMTGQTGPSHELQTCCASIGGNTCHSHLSAFTAAGCDPRRQRLRCDADHNQRRVKRHQQHHCGPAVRQLDRLRRHRARCGAGPHVGSYPALQAHGSMHARMIGQWCSGELNLRDSDPAERQQ